MFIIVSTYICLRNYKSKRDKYMIIPINYNIYNNIEKHILDIVNNINNYSFDEINEKINEIINLYIDDYFPNRNIKNITPTEKINGTRLFIFIHSITMF